MKKTLLVLTLFLLITLSGCNKEKAYLYFSSKPISKQTFSYQNIEKVFKIGNKIHFLVVCPKGFESDLARIQIVKMNDNAQTYGYSIAHGRDIPIKKGANYCINNFHLYNNGYYLVRFFTHNDLQKPIAQNDFWIK